MEGGRERGEGEMEEGRDEGMEGGRARGRGGGMERGDVVTSEAG